MRNNLHTLILFERRNTRACIRRVICSKSVTTDTGVVLIPNTPITPTNLSEYRFIIACNINTPTANNQLFIQTTAGNVPVLCKYGNELYANQVDKRVNYPLIYGNQNSSYTLGQFVIPSCNCINPRAVTTTTEVNPSVSSGTRKEKE